jgi:hypothetical protein
VTVRCRAYLVNILLRFWVESRSQMVRCCKGVVSRLKHLPDRNLYSPPDLSISPEGNSGVSLAADHRTGCFEINTFLFRLILRHISTRLTSPHLGPN